MQFRKDDKQRIRSGELTSSFRAWKSPRAKVGGRYNLHPKGAIEVTRVVECTPRSAKLADARAAGFASKESLAQFLDRDMDDTIYQVHFIYLGVDLVKQPSRDKLANEDIAALIASLGRMDTRAASGPWTETFLRLIREHPATRAADLAASIGWETPRFKAHVRRLKKLGLTISLDVGYELSPRGKQVLES